MTTGSDWFSNSDLFSLVYSGGDSDLNIGAETAEGVEEPVFADRAARVAAKKRALEVSTVAELPARP